MSLMQQSTNMLIDRVNLNQLPSDNYNTDTLKRVHHLYFSTYLVTTTKT